MYKLIQNQYISFALGFIILFLFANVCFAEFTIDDEKKLGKEFNDKLVENNLLLKDKILNNYINKIGHQVLAQTEKAPFEFKFYIVNSSAINAFATPGGYIYINKGLISVAENEGELAGVIAHEIGHANARHIASIIDKSKKLNMASLAAILAGVLLGGGGETSAAVAALSIAGSSTMTLRYMREHEEEADRLGLIYLTDAGYYPEAMIDFLKIMKRYEFLSKTMPSYLQTQPGTDDRIFYMDSLILSKYNHKGAKNIIGNFNRMNALISLEMPDLKSRNKKLEESLKTAPDNVDLLYCLALTEERLGQTESALKHYQRALSFAPRDEDILKNIGLIYLKMGKADLALNYLLRCANLNPDNDEVTLAMGKSFFALNKYQNALDCFLKLKDKSLDDDINYFIAMTYGKLNNQGESHYYFGMYFKKERKNDSAFFHFKEALNYFPPGSDRNNVILNEIKEINKDNSGGMLRKPKPKTENGPSFCHCH